MSQQTKCDRCGSVGDADSAPGHGSCSPPGWRSIHVYAHDMMDLRVDLCGKCFLEVIEKGGLAFAVKKAEAAWGDMDRGIVGSLDGSHPMHRGGPSYGSRRPWPPPRSR
jgi:hypothetical protein